MAILRHVEFETGHSDGMLVNVYDNGTGSLLGAFTNPGVISQPIAAVPAYDIDVGSITGNWIVDVFISGLRTSTVFASDYHLVTEDSPPWLTGSGTTIDAAGIRSAVGLTSANLNTQLNTIQSTNLNNSTDIAALASQSASETADIELEIFNLDQKVNLIPRSGQTFKHRNTSNSTEADVVIEGI